MRRKTEWGEIGEEIPTGGEMEIDRPQVNTAYFFPSLLRRIYLRRIVSAFNCREGFEGRMLQSHGQMTH